MGATSVSQNLSQPPENSSDAAGESNAPVPVPSSPAPPPTDRTESTSDEAQDDVPSDQPSTAKSEMITRNTLALEAQVEERPLAKKQEQLESDEDDERPSADVEPGPGAVAQSNGGPFDQGEHTKPKHHRKALLKNDDTELLRVGQVRFQLFVVACFPNLGKLAT